MQCTLPDLSRHTKPTHSTEDRRTASWLRGPGTSFQKVSQYSLSYPPNLQNTTRVWTSTKEPFDGRFSQAVVDIGNFSGASTRSRQRAALHPHRPHQPLLTQYAGTVYCPALYCIALYKPWKWESGSAGARTPSCPVLSSRSKLTLQPSGHKTLSVRTGQAGFTPFGLPFSRKPPAFHLTFSRPDPHPPATAIETHHPPFTTQYVLACISIQSFNLSVCLPV